MIFRSNAGPQNRRTKPKTKNSQSLLDVKIRATAATAQRNSKIMKWLCVLILIGTAGFGIYCGVREGLRRFVFENPDYLLSSLEIVTDGALSREEVMQSSGIREGANIFSINLARAQQRLINLPRVEVAEITRTLPNRISINITERKPVAWIAAKNTEDPSSDPKSFLVDRRGTLIAGKNYLPEYLHLPIIYGIPTDNLEAGETVDTYELRAALDLVRITSESPKVQVRSIDLSKRYCMIVTDRSRAKITFGLEKIDEQLDRLAAVLEHVEATKQEIRTVNLLVQRNIPVTFASESNSSEASSNAAEAPVSQKGQKLEKPQQKAMKSQAASDRPSSPDRQIGSGHSQSIHPERGRDRANDASTGRKAPSTSRPPSPQTAQFAKKPQPSIRRAVPANPSFMENMPVRKAIPVNSPDSSRHNG